MPLRKRETEKPRARVVRPPRRAECVDKHVIAVGFDLYDRRAVLKGNNQPEPGEPARGVGPLKAPWQNEGDRPLPWVMTDIGRSVLKGQLVLPNMCPKLPAFIPQPGHGRWQNPRPGDRIRLKARPGIYSVFVDDLDCSTDKIRILKTVRLFVESGDCDFVGASYIAMGGGPPRPYIEADVVYPEPKGWSLQPHPIIFGGRLIVRNAKPSVILVSVWKRPAPGEKKRVRTNYAIIRVLINPK